MVHEQADHAFAARKLNGNKYSKSTLTKLDTR